MVALSGVEWRGVEWRDVAWVLRGLQGVPFARVQMQSGSKVR